MILIFRIIIYICFQVLFCLTYQTLYELIFPILSTLSFFSLLYRGAGQLNQAQNSGQQKIQVFTPQGDKQFNFTDRANGTVAKILQSSLVIYKKKQMNSMKEEESIKEEKQLNIVSTSHQGQQQQVQQSPAVYLEQLYCMHCLIDQILRVRHCLTCNMCILTYDHHDIITGKCIGEKNKIIYILSQFFHLLQLTLIIVNFQQESIILIGSRLIALVIDCYILTLFGYQCYLILTNQTQAEHRFREKLPYMKYTKDEFLDPFNYGLKRNISTFIISSFQRQPFKWTFAS